MKQDQVFDLIRSLVDGDKQKIDIGFNRMIRDLGNTNGAYRLQRIYDSYKNNTGKLIELPQALKSFVCENYKEVFMDNLLLNDTIIEFLETIRKEWSYRKELREQGLTNSNRVLLVGPPGNGKTSFAIALAGYLEITPYIAVTNKLIDSHLGESEKNVINLIQNIPPQGLLFLDEFDTLGTSRTDDTASTGRAYNNIVNSLLMSLDRLPEDVVFVAATNRDDLLDSAVHRRFDVVLSFPDPTIEQKEMYVKQYMKRKAIQLPFDKEKIEKCTSYSDLEHEAVRVHKQCILSGLL